MTENCMKNLIALVMAGVMAVLVTSCGKHEAPKQPEAAAEAAAPAPAPAEAQAPAAPAPTAEPTDKAAEGATGQE